MDELKAYGIFGALGIICLLVWVWIYRRFERKTHHSIADENEKGNKQF